MIDLPSPTAMLGRLFRLQASRNQNSVSTMPGKGAGTLSAQDVLAQPGRSTYFAAPKIRRLAVEGGVLHDRQQVLIFQRDRAAYSRIDVGRWGKRGSGVGGSGLKGGGVRPVRQDDQRNSFCRLKRW